MATHNSIENDDDDDDIVVFCFVLLLDTSWSMDGELAILNSRGLMGGNNINKASNVNREPWHRNDSKSYSTSAQDRFSRRM
mmetsp:Transcript_18485/g.34424  ORF Transcript_18485/g.34424 Transcript_18485/m.34424 type:complete len:81 (+) Transcript_18485:1119-1361(+)